MTPYEEECFNELQRQLDTMPRVVLTEKQFHALTDLTNRWPRNYDIYWPANTRVFTLAEAEEFRNQIRHSVAMAVAEKLVENKATTNGAM